MISVFFVEFSKNFTDISQRHWGARAKFCAFLIHEITSVRRFLWYVCKILPNSKKNLYFVIIGRHSKNPIRSWLYISQKHFKYVYCLVNYNTIIKVFILFLCCFRDVDNCLNLRRGPDESFNLKNKRKGDRKSCFMMQTNFD